jgi:hypothetical protein
MIGGSRRVRGETALTVMGQEAWTPRQADAHPDEDHGVGRQPTSQG